MGKELKISISMLQIQLLERRIEPWISDSKSGVLTTQAHLIPLRMDFGLIYHILWSNALLFPWYNVRVFY